MTAENARQQEKLPRGDASRPPLRPWFTLVASALLVVAVGVAYRNSISAAFVFDDIPELVKEPNFRSFDAAVATRRPVGAVSFWANIRLLGLTPPVLRVPNIAIHAITGWLLFCLLRVLLPRALTTATRRATDALALLVALLWTVHPLQTQAVTYVVQRYESLMGMFFLASVLLSAKYLENGRRSLMVLAAVACALSCGSKAVGIAIPPAVLLIDAALYSDGIRAALRRHAGLYGGLLIGASMVVVTGVARGVLDPSRSHATVGLGFPGASPIQYALTQCNVIAHYVRLAIWPDVLCIDYDWPFARSAADLRWTGVLVPVAILVSAVLWRFRRSAALPVLLFALVLLPTSSFIPLQDAAVEHRMYLSLAPLLTAITVALFRAANWICPSPADDRDPQRNNPTRIQLSTLLVIAPLVLATVGSVLRTRNRNADYRTGVSLWAQTVAAAPQNARAHYNLARALHREVVAPSVDRLRRAYDEYRETLRLEPNNAEAYVGCAEILSTTGQPIAAIELYETALKLDPSLAIARCNYAAELADLGRYAEAEPNYRTALETAPNEFGCLYNYGTMLLQRGDAPAAVDLLERAVSINPTSGIALHNLGIALRRVRRLEDSIGVLRRAVEVRPDHVGTRCTLAETLLEADELDACEVEVTRLLQSFPDHQRAQRIARRLQSQRDR